MDEHAPQAKAAGRRLIDAFRADESFNFALREASIVVEAVVPGKDVRGSLFFLSSDGKARFWPGTIRRRLASAGLSEDLADGYVGGMRELLGVPIGQREPSRNVDQIDSGALYHPAKEFVNRVEEASS